MMAARVRRPGAPAVTPARAVAALLALLCMLVPLLLPSLPAVADPDDPQWAAGGAAGRVSPLEAAFAAAAAKYDVPRDLLVALGYSETHLDGHQGRVSGSGGFGVMHLVGSPAGDALYQAARLTGHTVEQLQKDDAANIAGGAAVLRAHADRLGLDAAARKDPARWYPAVAAYGGSPSPEVARLYADAVYDFLATGIQATLPSGEQVTVAARVIEPDRGAYGRTTDLNRAFAAAAVDYPSARWVAASKSNYTVSNRPRSDKIDRIVIHVTQGSYAGSIAWFQNPRSQVSAHYVVRSKDGAITQMVREKDRAWHVGNYNRRSIGIEHEGYVSDASWFTDAMYRASAALTRSIADRYKIPKDRKHIIGHVEAPGATHTDPGKHWDWARYMRYVNGGVADNPYKPEMVCGPGFGVLKSRPLGSAGTVYLLWNGKSGQNCVVTIKAASLGKETPATAFLEVEGKPRTTVSGNFAYYAGPVRAPARDACVKWGGKAGSSSYASGFEACP
ncbi:hypothetical protein HNP84_002076 [Thermocatellispora tengchongensis]|uniref:N-acetylmuramoyl-L-alanine amidase n=1 Tax=Thermocatellispora tengchongensis TaxID=1073253 RepID=A0A840P4F0_9ACTN|nr:N-acetylmuramoyl-L-alanine amidase [Thermocatellispora tengchongensis]MBB5132360.1 hypothetical protein [Thermocatellispora tengchongensis]